MLTQQVAAWDITLEWEKTERSLSQGLERDLPRSGLVLQRESEYDCSSIKKDFAKQIFGWVSLGTNFYVEL